MDAIKNKTNGTQEYKTILNEAELAYFEELILNKREETKNELNYLLGTLEDLRASNDDDASSIDHHMGDMGSIEESLDLTNWLIQRNIKFLKELERALVRIENGTYGICRATGVPIEKGRLEFAPHTRYSIAAKKSGLDKRTAAA